MPRRLGDRLAGIGPVVALMLVLCAIAAAAAAAEPKFPPLSGRVVDEAGLISPPARERIATWLEEFERATKRQVVVATVKSLQGYPIEEYGYRLGRAWGIGEKGRNTGAILLVAPSEHAVRIEVGYGLEGELTDAVSRIIIERDILPAFRQGNFEQGILAGTAAVLTALGWNGAGPRAAARSRGVSVDPGTLVFLFVFVLFFAMRMFRASGGYGPDTGMYGHGVWGHRSSGPFTMGGGSLGGGTFRGGGGSFGGGGASGRW